MPLRALASDDDALSVAVEEEQILKSTLYIVALYSKYIRALTFEKLCAAYQGAQVPAGADERVAAVEIPLQQQSLSGTQRCRSPGL